MLLLYNSEISDKQYLTLLFNCLSKKSINILHIHHYALLSVAAKLKKTNQEIKIIYDIHDNTISFTKVFFLRFRKKYLTYVDCFIISDKSKIQKKIQSYNKKIYLRENMSDRILNIYKEILH